MDSGGERGHLWLTPPPDGHSAALPRPRPAARRRCLRSGAVSARRKRLRLPRPRSPASPPLHRHSRGSPPESMACGPVRSFHRGAPPSSCPSPFALLADPRPLSTRAARRKPLGALLPLPPLPRTPFFPPSSPRRRSPRPATFLSRASGPRPPPPPLGADREARHHAAVKGRFHARRTPDGVRRSRTGGRKGGKGDAGAARRGRARKQRASCLERRRRPRARGARARDVWDDGVAPASEPPRCA